MRIAIIVAKPGGRRLDKEADALAKGMEAMGHRADVIDAASDDGVRLPGYEYIAVLTAPLSFFSGKIPDSVSRILSGGSSLVGKKGAAFLRSGGLFSAKALSNLMRAMEKEGMCVNWSETVVNLNQAVALGKRIGA